MKVIGSCAAQSLAGHSSDVPNLPTTESVMDDGTKFNAACGSTFLDVDTGDVYIFYKDTWYKI